MTKSQNRTGASLKALRTSHGVPQSLVAAMAGTPTSYLAKVEDGLITPTNSCARMVTEAIVRLMKDPPRPCPVIGCDNTEHIDSFNGSTGDPSFHHADCDLRGDDWKIEVRRFDGQDTEWVVYVSIEEHYALTPSSFVAMTDAYKRASAFAAALNGRGAGMTR